MPITTPGARVQPLPLKYRNSVEPQFRMADSHISSPGWAEFKRSAPMTRAFNHLIAGSHFHERFHRWPLPPRDPNATVNDFIFSRMIDTRWSPLQRAFVDKETAKAEALKLLPTLRVPRTLLVVPMEGVHSVAQLYELLKPFIGIEAIAKPTHASGAATFMRNVACLDDLALLYELACAEYTSIMREMQYFGLPKKIIVEGLVPTSTDLPPDDYKFHCINGEPLVCQIDHNRFGTNWSRLFRVPAFDPINKGDGLAQPESYRLPDPGRVAAMLTAARALAAPFDFARIDLYDGKDGIYFGEVTFTPAASLGIAPSAAGDHAENATHRMYSRLIMGALFASLP